MTKTNKLDRLFKCFWLIDKPPHKNWDILLNKLIDKGNVTHIDNYCVTFDDKYDVWITNHPYSSGNLYSNKIGIVSKPHCSKSTKIRLEDFVNSLPIIPSEDDRLIKRALNSFD